jgi:alpha-galactosidase
MSDSTRDILTHREVIAIDQDPLGKTARKVIDQGEFEVFLKPLVNERYAVCLFNREDFSADIQFNWAELALPGTYRLQELWENRDYGTTEIPFSGSIPRHGIKHFVLEPERAVE